MSTLTAESSNFDLDTRAPQGLAGLDALLSDADAATLSWTAATDASFNHYEIWYGTNQTDVQNRTGTATEWDDTDDANLATAGTTGTTITGLASSSVFYFAIWAVDDFNSESARVDSASTVNTTITVHADGDGTADNSSGVVVRDMPTYIAQVTIPVGAIPVAAGTVTVTIAEEDAPDPVPSARRSVLKPLGSDDIAWAYNVTDDITFDSPVTLRIKYDPVNVASHNVAEADLCIYKWNGSTWVALPTTVDETNNWVEAQTTTFSNHDVQGPPHPPICWNFTAAFQD